MVLALHITDGEGGKLRAAVVDDIEHNGLVVRNFPLKTYDNKQQFFTNDTYGAEMNQVVTFGGTADEVYDGTAATLWLCTTYAGNAGDFIEYSGTTPYHSAPGCMDARASENNDIVQFAKGSNMTVAGYTALTGWIYLTGWSTSGTKAVNIYGFDTGTNLAVSSELNIGDYVDTTSFNTWQQFIIPMSDFGFSALTIDAVHIRTVDIGVGQPPNYYIDDMAFQQTGTPIIYSIKPDLGTWLHVENFMISIANNVAGTVENGTVAGFDYSSWLGVNLITGVNYQRIQADAVKATAIIKSLADWLSLPETEVVSQMSDGTNSFISMRGDFTDAIILKSEEADELRIVISEDLSSLLHFRISAGCKEEQR